MTDFQQHSNMRTGGKDKERNYKRVLPYAKQLTEFIFSLQFYSAASECDILWKWFFSTLIHNFIGS
jgi:hypothetical protein